MLKSNSTPSIAGNTMRKRIILGRACHQQVPPVAVRCRPGYLPGGNISWQRQVCMRRLSLRFLWTIRDRNRNFLFQPPLGSKFCTIRPVIATSNHPHRNQEHHHLEGSQYCAQAEQLGMVLSIRLSRPVLPFGLPLSPIAFLSSLM